MIKISIVTIVKEIKEIHPEYVVLVKSGKFYRIYGRDAYIISYLFKYKIKVEGEIVSSGFPVDSLKRVQSTLENKKINYIISDSRTNYMVEEKEDFKNLNNYLEFYQKSKIYVNNQKRINKIYEYLDKNSEKEELKKILIEIERMISSNNI